MILRSGIEFKHLSKEERLKVAEDLEARYPGSYHALSSFKRRVEAKLVQNKLSPRDQNSLREEFLSQILPQIEAIPTIDAMHLMRYMLGIETMIQLRIFHDPAFKPIIDRMIELCNNRGYV